MKVCHFAVMVGGLTMVLAGSLLAASPFPAVLNRDPFQPLMARVCRDTQVAQWRLAGVMGNEARWVGWLVTPQHSWLRIGVGDTVPATGWQVVRLDQYEARLMRIPVDAQCQTAMSQQVLLAPGAVQRITDKGLE